MDAAALVSRLQELLPAAQIESVPSADAQATVYASPDGLHATLKTLRDQPELRFAFLSELTATDYLPREPRYEVVYILVSIEHQLRLRLKVRLPAHDPHVPTVSDLWPAANWLEREVWDLFGIAFDGHPDPRRLLMPEDWEGYPLRKDSPVQIQMTPSAASPTQMTEEEFRANLMKDRLART
jgi:NADH-quinone oxidoreductase subunit C